MKALSWIWDQIQAEPVAAQYLLQQAVAFLVLLDLPLSDPQKDGLLALSSALLAFITRRSVTPNVNVIAANPAPNPNVKETP